MGSLCSVWPWLALACAPDVNRATLEGATNPGALNHAILDLSAEEAARHHSLLVKWAAVGLPVEIPSAEENLAPAYEDLVDDVALLAIAESGHPDALEVTRSHLDGRLRLRAASGLYRLGKPGCDVLAEVILTEPDTGDLEQFLLNPTRRQGWLCSDSLKPWLATSERARSISAQVMTGP